MLGDRLIKVGKKSVATPTALKTYLRGKTGKTDVVVRRNEKEVTTTLHFTPQSKFLDRQYVLADGALIAEDAYPERWGMEGFYQTHSVREGSYAERVGWVQYRLIMSIDGVRPTSLAHIKELLTGDKNKVIIFRGWSEQTLLMHDYYEVEYWPYEVELKKAGE